MKLRPINLLRWVLLFFHAEAAEILYNILFYCYFIIITIIIIIIIIIIIKCIENICITFFLDMSFKFLYYFYISSLYN